jgi:predicted protein tyrosine phosphatase
MDAIRPWLYVGKYRETKNTHLLTANNIDTVLQLAEPVEYSHINSLYLPVEDGVPLPDHLLQQGVAFVLNAKRQGQRVLIACGAGISRSVVFAVAVLKEAENLGLLEALRIVHAHHPEALPHPALWESLCTYYQETVSISEMLDVL